MGRVLNVAVFGSKDLVIENARLEAKIELMELRLADKESSITELKEMLSNTQEALIAKEAPEAYRDQKYAEMEASKEVTPEGAKETAALQRRAETNAKYLESIEGPLFHNAQDMIDVLSKNQGVPTSKSLHDNMES